MLEHIKTGAIIGIALVVVNSIIKKITGKSYL